jgi:hypothetical protein
VVLLGRPLFTLPFRTLDEVLAASPLTIERKAATPRAAISQAAA